jgi:Ca2+-binding RTX toxin-like protein
VDAGAGNDNIDASGLVATKATINGDAGNDTIRGGSADDTLDGDGIGPIGNDLIFGGGGNDSIQGDGAEGYSSSGLGGKDTIVGGDGNDVIHADGAEGAYDDVVDAGEGDDTIFGDGDRVFRSSTASGRDVIIAGVGADVVHGGLGSDLIIAGATTLSINDVALVAAEWSRSVPRATRIANILGPGLPDRANESVYLLPNVNIVNDDAADQIFSDDGDDWIWLDLAIDESDATVTDQVVDIG